MNELLLYGTVGSSLWDEDHFTTKTVRDYIAGQSGPLTVRINSGGGIATEGQAIYNALREYPGEVHVIVEGIAASAASLIAMAGDTITMTLGAVMMIHDPANWWVEGRGTEEDHLHAAKMLSVIATAYAGIYAKRSGMGVDEAREIMRAETYYDGSAAVEAGFATSDGAGDETVEPAAFDYRIYKHAPARLLEMSGGLPRSRTRSSVLAMLAGPLTGKKGNPMPKPKATAQTAAEQDETEALEEEETDLEQSEDTEEETEGQDGEETESEEEDENPDASAIIRFAAAGHCTAAQGAHYIKARMSIGDVLRLHPDKGNTMTKPRAGLARSQMRRDETQTRLEGMIGALMGRTEGPASAYRGLRLKRLAMELGADRGRSRSFNDTDAVRMGMRSTTMMGGAIGVSDFAYITTEVMNRSLLAEYQRRDPLWPLVCGQALTAADFREIYAVRFGGDFQLKDVQENGEYQNATLADEAEGLKVQRRGRTITLSFESVINDDMGAFARIPREFAQAARQMENSMVWSLIRSNAVLKSDGKAIFHADHGNLAGTGTAISVTSIAAARKAMSEMRAFGSKDPDDFIAPEAELLIVPPALELAALQFTSDIVPTKSGDTNPYRDRFTVHSVANLGAVASGSDTAWYLIDPDLPPIQHAYLSGYEAPTVETIEGMNPDAVKMNARHIFGAAAVEFRGAFKNAGA